LPFRLVSAPRFTSRSYAKDTTTTRAIALRLSTAGIPSVVYGLFGLGLFVIFLNFGTSIWRAP
jgi:phosphate transport system permease protein